MSKYIPFHKNKTNFLIFLLFYISFCYPLPEMTNKESVSRKLTMNEKSTEICKKTSSLFSDYYKIGDRNILKMDEDNTEEYDKDHIQALINIVRHYYDKKRTKQNDNTRLLGLLDDSDDYKEDLFKYAYHILPLLIILGIGILSFIAWIVWCICTCTKCRCCVCKKSKFKTPSIVLALIFYVIVVLISLYSLVEENKIFTGLADLECSVLKFTDEVLEGENSPYPPFWAGIDNIKNIFGQIISKIDTLKTQTVNDLQVLNDDVNTKKGLFETTLQNSGNTIKIGYIENYGGHQYQLDIANLFGTYDKTTNVANPEKSVSNFWLKEYNSLAIKAENEMRNTIESFSIILNSNEITQSLTNADIKLNEIKTEFKSLKNLISDKIIEKADNIDKKGRIIYALFFSILIILCGAIIIFMLLLCCCSGEVCTNLTCFQCFFKYFLHIFWNIMAVIMILLFLGGSMFSISGVLGNDLVNVISFLISEDNLGQGKDTIILGNVKQYLNKCFNSDGNILNELDFDAKMEFFEKLKQTQLQIEEIKNQFIDKRNKFVYNEYLEELNNRVEYNSPELKLISVNPGITPPSYNFFDLIQKINEYADENNKNENWDLTSTSNEVCSSANPNEGTHTTKIIYHPKNCYPLYKSWINDASLSDYKTKLDDIKNIIELANDESNVNSIKSLLNSLNTNYDNLLETEIDTLGNFATKMKEITDLVKDYTSENDELFSFMNCKFVRETVEVILFYLKNSFGNDIYEVGVYLLISAFSLPFAISFTLLLISISNEEIEVNRENMNKKLEEEKKKRNSLFNGNDITINNGNVTEQRKLQVSKDKIG